MSSTVTFFVKVKFNKKPKNLSLWFKKNTFTHYSTLFNKEKTNSGLIKHCL